jgi:hypothetical protein
MLDIAIDFAKRFGYKRIVLDSSKYLYAARFLYLKKGFVDVSRYNNNCIRHAPANQNVLDRCSAQPTQPTTIDLSSSTQGRNYAKKEITELTERKKGRKVKQTPLMKL